MWWVFRRTPSALPHPTGPYQGSCVDLFTEYSVDGVLLRLYYPSVPVDEYIPEYSKWIPWLPGSRYCRGFARLWKVTEWLVRFAIWLIAGPILIPIEYGNRVRTNEKLKVVIFSHGLSGARFPYSAILTDLASQGFMVVAVEHRDRSACDTWYYKSVADATAKRKTYVEFKNIEFGQHNDQRYDQVRQRASECGKALDFILALQKGAPPESDVQPYFADEKRRFDFQLEQLVGKIDVDTITVMGHSFGGATALLTLAQRKELKQGVLLDPWMFPIKKLPDLHRDVTQPLLFINTQTFQIVPNVKAMADFYVDNPPNMYTILGTTHENQADGVFIVGYWLNWFMKKIPPREALKINNSLIFCFLNERIEYPADVSDYRNYLNKRQCDFVARLPKPWA